MVQLSPVVMTPWDRTSGTHSMHMDGFCSRPIKGVQAKQALPACSWAPPLERERRSLFYHVQFFMFGIMYSLVARPWHWKSTLIVGRYCIAILGCTVLSWRLDDYALWASLSLKDTKNGAIFFSGWFVAATLRKRFRAHVDAAAHRTVSMSRDSVLVGG